MTSGSQESLIGLLQFSLQLFDQLTLLSTLDKAIAGSLWALGFIESEAAACLLLLPQGERILEELRTLRKTSFAHSSHLDARQLVGVRLSSSARPYAAAAGQLLAAVPQGGPPSSLAVSMGDTYTPSLPATPGSLHSGPTDLLRSSARLSSCLNCLG